MLPTLKMPRSLYGLLFLCLGPLPVSGQDAARFQEEVVRIEARMDSLWNPERPAVVFTGSSSIRMWSTLSEDFPQTQVLNTGFGGSQASDLLAYLEPLVLKYSPVKVFIYEGDNDLAEGKRPGRILNTQMDIAGRIWAQNPGTAIVWIAAKPSISRWKLRGKYRRYNRKLARKAERDPRLSYVDVWTPMLVGRRLNQTLFIEDGLHMNAAGYQLWQAAIAPELETKQITP